MQVQYESATGEIVAYGQFAEAPDGYALAQIVDPAPLYRAGRKFWRDAAIVVAPYPPPDPAVEAARASEEKSRATTRATILATAQGAVGKAVDALTATERAALVTILLWRVGAITPQATVAPLDRWAADPARG